MLTTFLLLYTLLFVGLGEKCAWDNCHQWSKEKDVLNVHILSHTHDDMGWIKSVDEYYTGARRDLVPVGVQFILDSVLDSLEEDPNRRFSYAETGFLKQWLENQSPERVERFKKLVSEKGQLELIGGGWVQPDEAASHYYELIDQYTLGLGILNETFGKCGVLKVAWQIDSFGHSREHANLVSMMGYEALFFARQHHLELQKRANEKNLELIWNVSDDLKTNILTGGFLRGTYGQPDGFCFDVICNGKEDDPIIDNPNLQGFNLDVRVEAFVKVVREQASHQRHNHVLMTMGNDFTYSNADMWFNSLDKLIRGINNETSKYNMTAFYSTPKCYVNALTKAASHSLTIKKDDFFPYASSNHSYWTGYFTSKPALKGLIRKTSAFLQLVRQMNAFSFQKPQKDKEEILERALGLSQHHDAVTGTSKEAVTKDYVRRLLQGVTEGEGLLNSAFGAIAKRSSRSIALRFCQQMNESVCLETKHNDKVAVTVFNSNGNGLNNWVSIPFYNANAAVQNARGEMVPFQLSKTFLPSSQFSNNSSSPYQLYFQVDVPALGFKTYFISNRTQTRKSKAKGDVLKRLNRRKSRRSPKSIENNLIRLEFSESSGFLSKFCDLSSGKNYSLGQEFLYYIGVDNRSTQASGAYVFRPNGTQAHAVTDKVKLEINKTALVQEARQVFSPWVSQVIRLLPNQSYVEFDYIVGPLPKDERNLTSTEVITRYTVEGLLTKGVFKTDANGRQLMERRRNHATSFTFENTEPVSGNYYPVNSRILVWDEQKQLTVLTDRSQGGSSLSDGQLEVMLHRRCFWDDNWGVGEALDEPGVDGRGLVVRGRHWLLLGPTAKAARVHRTLAFEMFHQPVVTFSPFDTIQDYKSHFLTEWSPLASDLPPHVNLLTLKQLDENVLLLRLEHVYQSEEDSLLSQPVSVDLNQLFSHFDIIEAQELSLAANTIKSSDWEHSSNDSRQRIIHGKASAALTVQLKPMEIRTFQLRVNKRVN